MKLKKDEQRSSVSNLAENECGIGKRKGEMLYGHKGSYER